MRHPRGPLDQRAQVALGPRDCKVLQHASARIHEGDDRPGEGLAQGQRARHRQERDRVNTEPPGQNVANDGGREAGRDRNCSKREE